eukprot:8461600-Lingulodinium_polyedra.AAC.1
MVSSTTPALQEVGLVWKESSLEVLLGPTFELPDEEAEKVWIVELGADKPALSFSMVEEITCLGVVLDRRGSTEASFASRRRKADACFF